MTKQYVKYDENYKVTERAPVNKGAVSNYNSPYNDAQLKADGYSYVDTIFYPLLGADYVVGHEPAELLAATKASKIEEMKQIRDNEEQEFFVYNGNKYDGDVISITRLQVAAGEATKHFNQEGYVQYWTDYDNNLQALSAQDMLDIMTAVKDHSQNVHTKYNVLKTQVANATTVEEVEAIVWK